MKYKVLVNKDNKLKENFLNKITLINTYDVDNEEIQVEEETYQKYLELQKFLLTKNITIGISSGFRSLSRQQEIYEEFITEYGIDYANKIVAPVGTSEHHTGLALDIDLKINGRFLETNMELMKSTKKSAKVCLCDFYCSLKI